MLLLPITNKLFHKLFVGWVLHEGRVDAHILDLIEQVEPRLIHTLGNETLVCVVPHVCDVHKRALSGG